VFRTAQWACFGEMLTHILVVLVMVVPADNVSALVCPRLAG
jgi:hypothetical protein